MYIPVAPLNKRYVPILEIVHRRFSGECPIVFLSKFVCQRPFVCRGSVVIFVSDLSAHLFFLRSLAATASASTAVEMSAGNRVGQPVDECVGVGGGSGSFVIVSVWRKGRARRRGGSSDLGVHLSTIQAN